jgi:HTH-type transcriptional regulator/antitoxin MqsA
LVGGGPRAFQKQESGDLLPSRAAGSALALLDHDPKALKVLRRRFEPARAA